MVFPPELQVKQYVARVQAKFGLHWYVYKTGSDRHYLFACAEYPHIQVPVLKSSLRDDVRSALANGWGHADEPGTVLVAVIRCPEGTCATEFEGTWLEPRGADDDVEPCLQECPSCATRFEAAYPGYSFRTEAG